MDIVRVARGSSEEYGVGDSFILPRDNMPEGLKTGESMCITLKGVITGMDEQGLVVKLEEPIEWRNATKGDPLQESIEQAIDITINNK